MKKKNLKYALMMNAVIILLECIGLSMSAGQMGMRAFLMYTEDSNILNLVMCTIFLIMGIRSYHAEQPVEHWVKVCRYVGVCTISLTFLVVVLVLAQESGYEAFLIQGQFKFTHLLCPVMSFLSFVLFEQEPKLEKKDTAAAVIPTLVYAVILIALNLAKTVTGPYPFLQVYRQPWYISVLWAGLILGGAYLFAAGMVKLDQRRH